MIIGFNNFGIDTFASSGEGVDVIGTWNEICPNESEWTQIPSPQRIVERCEDAS